MPHKGTQTWRLLIAVYLCLITSIETRNVRFFTFVFSVKGMISVILILVVAVYQTKPYKFG